MNTKMGSWSPQVGRANETEPEEGEPAASLVRGCWGASRLRPRLGAHLSMSPAKEECSQGEGRAGR